MTRRLVLALTLALLAASCATVPPPRVATPPPPVTAPPAARPAEKPAPPPAPAGPLRLDREPTITVGLAWDLDTLTLVVEGGEVADASRGHAGRSVAANGALSFRARGAGVGVACAAAGGGCGDLNLAGGVLFPDTVAVGAAGAVRGEEGFRWNGRRWRGTALVFVNPRGRLTLAARLPLESYLLGVVPGEIGALSPALLEAGRAQAIAARSYTLHYRGRRAAEGFDLYGTVEDQVHGPVETERPLASQCVESTRGEVALHDGQPIRANYCADCGGITAEVWEAWPAAPAAYLESRRDRADGSDHCAASPSHRWRERWSAEEFMANVTRYAPGLGVGLPRGGLGQLVDVRVDARSRSGRVWRLRVSGTAGDLAIPAYAVRGVLRRGGRADLILRSNLFKIGVRRDPGSGRALEVLASGAGAGHGVGLCQTGALGMARRGVAAREILGHYYPRAEVRRLY
jgi:stage II sporulation protein D